MIEVTLGALTAHLKNENYDASIQKETSQVYAVLKIDGKEFPLFLRIFDESDLLQLIIFIPTPIKEGTEGDLARILHLINRELDIPGFGMDEKSGVAFYRIMLPTASKKIGKTLLNNYLKSMELICKNFSPVVMAVGNGLAKYDEILKQVQTAE